MAHNEDEHPRGQQHDLILIPRTGVIHRLLVNKTGEDVGNFTRAPSKPSPLDPGYRKAESIARHHDRRTEQQWGPAFGLLPMKPEPASSSWSCYLLNEENVAISNPWTSTQVALGYESDIWNELRNGCIVGTARYYYHPDGKPRVLPLVNVTALRLGGVLS